MDDPGGRDQDVEASQPGYDAADVCELLDLPDMAWSKPEPEGGRNWRPQGGEGLDQ